MDETMENLDCRFTSHEETGTGRDCCPMLVQGGVQCRHEATIVPQDWEVPAYCVPGKAICECCYRELRAKAWGLPIPEGTHNTLSRL